MTEEIAVADMHIFFFFAICFQTDLIEVDMFEPKTFNGRFDWNNPSSSCNRIHALTGIQCIPFASCNSKSCVVLDVASADCSSSSRLEGIIPLAKLQPKFTF